MGPKIEFKLKSKLYYITLNVYYTQNKAMRTNKESK